MEETHNILADKNNNVVAPEEIAPVDVINVVQIEEENIKEENIDDMQPENDNHLDDNQSSEELTSIGDQRSNDNDMGIRSWCDAPRRSNRIAQRPPNPNH